MNENDWEDVFLDADFFTPDKREQERHGLRVKVGWVLDSVQYKGVSSDVSSGGLFVTADTIPEHGAKFPLAFKLPNFDDPIRVVARVAWSRAEAGELPDEPRGFGIEFIKITPQSQEVVNEFIELSEALLFSGADF